MEPLAGPSCRWTSCQHRGEEGGSNARSLGFQGCISIAPGATKRGALTCLVLEGGSWSLMMAKLEGAQWRTSGGR